MVFLSTFHWSSRDEFCFCGNTVVKCTVFFSLCSEHDLGEDDIYDCVPCEDDGDDIYEDIIKVEVRQPMVRTLDVWGGKKSLFLSVLPWREWHV